MIMLIDMYSIYFNWQNNENVISTYQYTVDYTRRYNC